MAIRLKELPESERPYEKLQMYGESVLSNSELLAIIIKTGTKDETAVQLAQKVLALNKTNIDNLRFLQEISIQELMNVKGIGRVKAIELKAMCEIAKRMSRPIKGEKIVIKSPQDVANLLLEELRYEKREILKVIILNTKNVVQKIVNVAIGGVSSINIEPKDILHEAVKMGMDKIIIVHNHPSGNPTPSESDIQITYRLQKCANLFGIKLLDHIVIGDGTFKSIFSENKS